MDRNDEDGRRPGADGSRGDGRRTGFDRRSGIERRDRGGHQPLSAQVRSYGFREFRDRRAPQDRRLYGAGAGAWDGPADRSRNDPDLFTVSVRLSQAELAALLSDD